MNMQSRKAEQTHDPIAAISFTFDDGRLSTYTHAYPLMREAGLVGHIAVVTDLVGELDHYTWEQIREMAAAGWEVESHSCTHNLADTTLDNLLHEVLASKHALEAHGLKVNIFNFPGGPWQNDPVFLPGGPFERMVRQHYSGYLTDPMPHPMRLPADPYRLGYQTGECYGADQFSASLEAIRDYIDEAIAKGGWCNSLWHDVTTNNGKHWPKFQRIVSYATGRIREGRLRCVTSSGYLGWDRMS